MIDKLIELFKGVFDQFRTSKKRTYLFALIFIGILFIIVSNMLTTETNNETSFEQELTTKTEIVQEDTPMMMHVEEMEKKYEETLQVMLNQINGISEVEVMVNVDSTNVQIYEKDMIIGTQRTEESDQNGGNRLIEDETKETKLVYIREGDKEIPVLIQTKKPEVRGVLVIANGVESATLKQAVIEAVSRVLDVPTYRISVLPK